MLLFLSPCSMLSYILNLNKEERKKAAGEEIL
jgi:hypothetical protein